MAAVTVAGKPPKLLFIYDFIARLLPLHCFALTSAYISRLLVKRNDGGRERHSICSVVGLWSSKMTRHNVFIDSRLTLVTQTLVWIDMWTVDPAVEWCPTKRLCNYYKLCEKIKLTYLLWQWILEQCRHTTVLAKCSTAFNLHDQDGSAHINFF